MKIGVAGFQALYLCLYLWQPCSAALPSHFDIDKSEYKNEESQYGDKNATKHGGVPPDIQRV
jgi:hypothetical protein